MNSDLQHLIQLQEIELTADRIRRRIEAIPGAQAALDARIAEQTARVAAIKERIAVNQAARRDLEKDLAAVQARLSKYKDQLMEVKTNKEYQAMQHEISVAEQSVRGQEDRLLERMEETEILGAELKTAEAALKSEQAEVTKERQSLESERTTLDGELARACGRARSGRSIAPGKRALDIRAAHQAPKGPGAVGGAGRPLLTMSRPASPAGLQRGSAQRQPDPVRELLSHSLFHSGSHRRRPPDTLTRSRVA